MPVDGSDVEVKKLESEKVWKAPTKYLRQGERKKQEFRPLCYRGAVTSLMANISYHEP